MRLSAQLDTVVRNSEDRGMGSALGGRSVNPMKAFMENLGYEPYRKHGPHVVVGSEPTTLYSGSWYRLTNGNAIMVDIKHSGELNAPLRIKASNISEINPELQTQDGPGQEVIFEIGTSEEKCICTVHLAGNLR